MDRGYWFLQLNYKRTLLARHWVAGLIFGPAREIFFVTPPRFPLVYQNNHNKFIHSKSPENIKNVYTNLSESLAVKQNACSPVWLGRGVHVVLTYDSRFELSYFCISVVIKPGGDTVVISFMLCESKNAMKKQKQQFLYHRKELYVDFLIKYHQRRVENTKLSGYAVRVHFVR